MTYRERQRVSLAFARTVICVRLTDNVATGYTTTWANDKKLANSILVPMFDDMRGVWTLTLHGGFGIFYRVKPLNLCIFAQSKTGNKTTYHLCGALLLMLMDGGWNESATNFLDKRVARLETLLLIRSSWIVLVLS